ncbi:unnamed protein product [Meganyctiphanes norvegica]|uniref:Platelet-derived growth factor receptor-like protein n=1 Tax=Meganyctiphanes norvegica TaxID=48144 RepID=A0AAV2RQW4_MEGNR
MCILKNPGCIILQRHTIILLLQLVLLPITVYSANDSINFPSSRDDLPQLNQDEIHTVSDFLSSLDDLPQLNREETYTVIAGNELQLECRGKKNVNWIFPPREDPTSWEEQICNGTAEQPFCSTFKIHNARIFDTGVYVCVYQDNSNAYDQSIVYVHDNKTFVAVPEKNRDVQLVVGAVIDLICLPTLPNISLTLTKDGTDLTNNFTWVAAYGFIKYDADISDSGFYTCIAEEYNYHGEIISVTIQENTTVTTDLLTETATAITPSSSNSENEGWNNMWMYVAAGSAVLGLLIGVVVIMVVVCHKRKNNSINGDDDDDTELSSSRKSSSESKNTIQFNFI